MIIPSGFMSDWPAPVRSLPAKGDREPPPEFPNQAPGRVPVPGRPLRQAAPSERRPDLKRSRTDNGI